MEPKIFILKNNKIEVHIANLGATLVSIITKNANGKPIDVLLGFNNVENYRSPEYLKNYPYFGAGIGRYGNRIANGRFAIDGKIYQLAVNNGKNHLHGGRCGFDQKIWDTVENDDSHLVLKYVSPDGEENYPGTLTVQTTFSIKNKELQIHYNAKIDKKCFVSLTHHPYFNLNPAENTIGKHLLKLYTNKYLKTNDLIPDGTFVEASGCRDFSKPQKLENAINKVDGLDDCYVFDNNGKIARLAELWCAETGIKLYVCSNNPGLQVYTGKYVDVQNGKGGRHYGAFAGVALEAQYFPDSPNHPNFPSTLLQPNEEYDKTTIYGFE